MDKRKVKVRGIIAAFCLLAAAFGIRAVKNGVFSSKHPKNEFSVSVADSYTRYEDEGRKMILVVKYDLYNGTDSERSYVAFKDYVLQDGKECIRRSTGTGLPSERVGLIKALQPGEEASFCVEYEISKQKGNINLCVDRNFVKAEEREYIRMVIDPITGKEI